MPSLKSNSNDRLEWGSLSLKKKGEELCGDHVETVSGKNGEMTLVLADGLGSGVSANILSTLASSMLARMIEGGISIREAAEALVKTLPASRDRGNIAYSTFSILHVEPDFGFTLYNYDNPLPIFLRDKQELTLNYTSIKAGDKEILQAEGVLEENDVILLLSDGAVYAGVGEVLNFGWTREEIVKYVSALYDQSISAKNLVTIVLEHCDMLYNRRPGDDTTALAVKRRKPVNLSLMVGPPSDREKDEQVLDSFFGEEGIHVVSGGTSSKLAARYLHQDIEVPLDYEDPEIPPICYIKGVDLVTEGVITLNRVNEILKDHLGDNKLYFDWCFRKDGASLLAKALIEEATDVKFYVGCAVNPAHQDPSLKISISTKMLLVEELSKNLKKMGKFVEVLYF